MQLFYINTYMKQNPLISVIIPVYNRLNLLREALDSVKAQTYTNYEVIIVDDGSTDKTPQLAAESDYKYVRINHSGMPGYVRNRGVELAKGKYLAFLDSDDLWRKDKLERQIGFSLGNKEIKISHTREHWIRNNRTVSQKKQKHRREGYIFDDALKKCIIGPSTVMLETSFFKKLGGFRPDLEIAEDYEFWLRVTAGHPVGYLDIPLTTKRAGHGEQLSEKYDQIEKFRIHALKDLIDKNTFQKREMDHAKHEFARKCSLHAAGCKKRGKIEEAEQYESLIPEYVDMQ